jgi:hypothetical protein
MIRNCRAVTLGIYASIRKHLSQPLVFPGSSATYNLPYDFSTATHNAAQQLYLVNTRQAYDRTFNVHDGKPLRFAELWPKVAEYVPVGICV